MIMLEQRKRNLQKGVSLLLSLDFMPEGLSRNPTRLVHPSYTVLQLPSWLRPGPNPARHEQLIFSTPPEISFVIQRIQRRE